MTYGKPVRIRKNTDHAYGPESLRIRILRTARRPIRIQDSAKPYNNIDYIQKLVSTGVQKLSFVEFDTLVTTLSLSIWVLHLSLSSTITPNVFVSFTLLILISPNLISWLLSIFIIFNNAVSTVYVIVCFEFDFEIEHARVNF